MALVAPHYAGVMGLPSVALFDNGITWTLWLDRSEKCASTTEFTAGLRKIYKISSMQVLWSVCQSILPVCELNIRHSYHFMLDERRPVWEDEINSTGGTWSFRCAKSDTEVVWRTMLEALITGEMNHCVSSCDRLVGLSVGVRETEDVIHIWNTDATKAKNATLINFVTKLLPKITFRNALYKPFKEKNQSAGKNERKVETGPARVDMEKLLPKCALTKPKPVPDSNSSSKLKTLKSVSFSTLVKRAIASKGKGGDSGEGDAGCGAQNRPPRSLVENKPTTNSKNFVPLNKSKHGENGSSLLRNQPQIGSK